MYENGRRPRTLEWGVGGGANAVHFAPLADVFIGVDIVQASLEEAGRQVEMACSTPYIPVLIDIDAPEKIRSQLRQPCDLFLSFYVFELLPSEDYGWRVLELAFELLSPGGVALIQIKYSTVKRQTWSRGFDYRRNLANMTTFPIDEFWGHAQRVGFDPQAVALVPENKLDRRYAYFVLKKS